MSGRNVFVAGLDATVDTLSVFAGDPFSDTKPTLFPLPEPVTMQAGKQYEAGIDDDGTPFLREIVTARGHKVDAFWQDEVTPSGT